MEGHIWLVASSLSTVSRDHLHAKNVWLSLDLVGTFISSASFFGHRNYVLPISRPLLHSVPTVPAVFHDQLSAFTCQICRVSVGQNDGFLSHFGTMILYQLCSSRISQYNRNFNCQFTQFPFTSICSLFTTQWRWTGPRFTSSWCATTRVGKPPPSASSRCGW